MAAAASVPLIIFFDQPEGQKLLSDVRDGHSGCYQPILHSIFSQQTTRAGCGIQTCALLLSANAIGCRINSSRHHVTDMFHQPLSSAPAKRRKKDYAEKTVRTKNHSPSDPLFLEQSNKQTSPTDKDNLVAKGGFAASTTNSVFNLPYTEVGLYSMPETMTVTNREWVASHGLTLIEVAAILRAHGCTVWTVHSSSTTVSQFRRDLLDALSSADSCSGIVLNFHRGPLSTGEKARKSHHSPAVAYHKASDNLLVLDTAAPIERHFWTSVEAMFTAMLTVDHVSGKSRGYCFFVKPST